jgi:hypothetical protein
MLLCVQGENDYGALKAEAYGTDKLINKALDDEASITEDEENDFSYRREMYEFPCEKSRDEALAMMESAVHHIGDYDSRKHTDCLWHVLSVEECRRYLKS